MKILLCPDSFKGSLSAAEAAEAMARGAARACPATKLIKMPLADGGEGTVDALVNATGGEFVEVNVRDPLMRWVSATFGILCDSSTAVIEMAAASGLQLLSEDEYNPRIASTYGTGQLILSALHQGVNRIIVGIGGSATNDGGAGMAQAMGARLLDGAGRSLPPGGAALIHLCHISMSEFLFPIDKVRVEVACDVINPLTGPNGASAVYGPQKGATPEIVRELDLALAHYAEILRLALDADVADLPGAGAAGGLGAGLAAFLGAQLKPGIDTVLDAVGFDDALDGTDLILTGEGKIDAQTAQGKTVAGVAARAKAAGVPVIAIGGVLEDAPELRELGLRGIYSLTSENIGPEEAMRCAAELLEERTFEVLGG